MIQGTFAQPTFPELYEQWLVPPLFRPWVDDLFDRAGLARGDRVLDVACGTGVVARLAHLRVGDGGRVLGVDVSAQMLAVAHSAAPAVEWREGDALRLPVDEAEAFDVVFCQQGLQFFPDRSAALQEMRRVLAVRGRVAVATWRPLEEIPFFLSLHRIAERHLGPMSDRRHSLGDERALAGLLEGAGFREVRVDTLTRRLRFEDPAMFLRLNATALVGMRYAPNSITEEQRGQLVDTIARECEGVMPSFAENGGIAFEMGTNLATGRA